MILTLPFPVSSNRYWRTALIGGHVQTYVSKEAVAYKREVRIAAYEQHGKVKPIVGRVSVAVRLYPHRPQDWLKRARANPLAWDDTVQCLDLDNGLKVLIDALKGVAYRDDAWVRELSAERMEPDALGARVLVAIEPIVRQALPLGCAFCGKSECPGELAHVSVPLIAKEAAA